VFRKSKSIVPSGTFAKGCEGISMGEKTQDSFSRMDGSFRILSICDDEGLRHSRELLLTSEGYSTLSVRSDVVLSREQAQEFDAVLICRSVAPRKGLELTEMLERYNPAIQIMCIGPVENADDVDYRLPVLRGPQVFLDEVNKMRRSVAARKALNAGG
jgi:CheY-like chemotaxis protein